MNLTIKGKRALIMGASRGLGFAVAKELAAEGVITAICSSNKENIERAAQEIGAVPFQADLSKPDVAKKLVADVIAKLGGIDILVVNNGGPVGTTFDTSSDNLWREAFEALFMTTVDSVRACLPGMKNNGWGRIMVITSVAAKEPLANLILSNSLRAGIHGLVNSMSKEFAKFGITVNAIMPGVIMTERISYAFKKLNVTEEQATANIPAGRVGQPEELAALVTFLASERASYITGQAIAVDGGMSHSI